MTFLLVQQITVMFVYCKYKILKRRVVLSPITLSIDHKASDRCQQWYIFACFFYLYLLPLTSLRLKYSPKIK